MSVRAKFKVTSVRPADASDPEGAANVELHAVYDGSPENKEFWRLTPAGSILLSTINPVAWKQFEPGDEFYVDFTKAGE